MKIKPYDLMGLNALGNPTDAVANLVYHQTCWVYKKREDTKNDAPYEEKYDDARQC